MIPSDQSPGWGRDHGGHYDHGVMVMATAMASNDANVAPSAGGGGGDVGGGGGDGSAEFGDEWIPTSKLSLKDLLDLLSREEKYQPP